MNRFQLREYDLMKVLSAVEETLNIRREWLNFVARRISDCSVEGVLGPKVGIGCCLERHANKVFPHAGGRLLP